MTIWGMKSPRALAEVCNMQFLYDNLTAITIEQCVTEGSLLVVCV